MKYLITGGSGFIGSAIANKLGKDCVVIDNLSTGNKKNLDYQNTLLQGDILDEKFIDQVFTKYKPERVIHLAAQVNVTKSIIDPLKDADINIKGTLNILRACVKYKCQKIVFASSVAVYGDTDQFPIKETHAVKPINPYGVSKLTTELYGNYFYKQFGLNFVALRYANVYGPKQNSSGEGGVIAIFVNKLSKKEPLTIFGDGEQTRDFIYVDDIRDATIEAVNNNKIGVYNVSTNQEHSINALYKILQKMGYPATKLIRSAKRPGDIDRSILNNNKIKKDFNWSPKYNLEKGLIKMLKIHAS